jgi:hypothetical protein
MKKVFGSYSLALALAGLIGCSGFDTTQVLIHPKEVKPSATFDVALVNIFTFLDSSSTISNKIVRDSLHLLVGLPESWNVTGATMVVASDMNGDQLFALQNSLLDEQAIAGVVQQYQSKAIDLPNDAALSSQIQGDTIAAHNQAGGGQDIDVIANKVKLWKGFSAPVNIVLEKGTKPDTLFQFDSAISLASTTGLIDDSTVATIATIRNNPFLSSLLPDTVGITMVPVVLFLKIQAGSIEENDTLYYFSKTGMMNPPPSAIIGLTASFAPQMAPQLSALEYGDMTYMPISVKNDASALRTMHSVLSPSEIKAVTDGSGSMVRIELGNLNRQQTVASIYSLQGSLVASLVANGGSSIRWNGTDIRGNRVPAGSYIIRVGDGLHRTALGIHLIK